MNAIPKGHPAWRKYVPPFQYILDDIRNDEWNKINFYFHI
jgi:hypothetical protein